MQLLHPRRHRSLETGDVSGTRVQAALELEFHLLSVLVDLGADHKESVRGSQRLIAGRVTAANCDGGGRLLENLKVVCDVGALVVGAGGKLLIRPQLLGRLRATPLVVQISALHSKA